MNSKIRNPVKFYNPDRKLNQYIKEKCTPDMTVNDIDLIQYLATEDKKYLRITEVKRKTEKWDASQDRLLKALKNAFSFLNRCKFEYGYTPMEFQIYRVTWENDYFHQILVDNLITGKHTEITGHQEVKMFLEFKFNP